MRQAGSARRTSTGHAFDPLIHDFCTARAGGLWLGTLRHAHAHTPFPLGACLSLAWERSCLPGPHAHTHSVQVQPSAQPACWQARPEAHSHRHSPPGPACPPACIAACALAVPAGATRCAACRAQCTGTRPPPCASSTASLTPTPSGPTCPPSTPTSRVRTAHACTAHQCGRPEVQPISCSYNALPHTNLPEPVCFWFMPPPPLPVKALFACSCGHHGRRSIHSKGIPACCNVAAIHVVAHVSLCVRVRARVYTYTQTRRAGRGPATPPRQRAYSPQSAGTMRAPLR